MHPWERQTIRAARRWHPVCTGDDMTVAAPPPGASLSALRAAAAGCRACDLWRNATQTVFGEGAARARLMLVGEQPGDQEDLAGEPFVGPSGALLDRALEEASIDRRLVYVTNIVKHFKWKPRGKRRLHQTPTAYEIRACRPWLAAELASVKPDLVVALGATAARGLVGPAVRVTRQHGQVLPADIGPVGVTVHPSSILRATDDEARRSAYATFVADLRAFRP